MIDHKIDRENAVRETKKNLILDGALDVFLEKGYHDARLEDIAERAGFSKASLYNYYDDKEAIFFSLGLREHSEMTDSIRKASDPALSFYENISNVIEVILELISQKFAFSLAVVNSHTMCLFENEYMKSRHAGLIGEFMRNVEENFNNLTELIESAREKGEISSSVESSAAARYFISLMRGVYFFWKSRKKPGDLTKEKENILNFLCSGLGMEKRKGLHK
ncbi:MAG: TetR/AcrR family transcriptional regulator [Fibrobacterota bacterium]